LLPCCAEGFDLNDALLDISLGIPEVDRAPSVEPELRGVAEQARKAKSHPGCDGRRREFSPDLWVLAALVPTVLAFQGGIT
jgi:hypothetical protein